MSFDANWEFWIVAATLLSGGVILFYWLLGKRNSDSVILDYAKSFFPVLLFVVVLRSFVAEPFRIPSGSMIPTLEIGDFILVKKYAYGIRLPVIHTEIIHTGSPQRGDVVVFRYPPNPKINYIKRLIGMPGDHIKFTADKKLYINGKLVKTKAIDQYQTKNNLGKSMLVAQFDELLPASDSNDKDQDRGAFVEHRLIHFPGQSRLIGEWTVPEGHYFMMGDNRENSSDSRVWGFVPEKNLVGKASLVWMHWNWLNGGDGFQSGRIGAAVN